MWDSETSACMALMHALAESAKTMRDFERRLRNALGSNQVKGQNYLARHVDRWIWQVWLEVDVTDNLNIEWRLEFFVQDGLLCVESYVGETDQGYIHEFPRRSAHSWQEAIVEINGATEDLVTSIEKIPLVAKMFQSKK
jgi:hypothetical protein